jgi:hypothetical protein
MTLLWGVFPRRVEVPESRTSTALPSSILRRTNNSGWDHLMNLGLVQVRDLRRWIRRLTRKANANHACHCSTAV